MDLDGTRRDEDEVPVLVLVQGRRDVIAGVRSTARAGEAGMGT